MAQDMNMPMDPNAIDPNAVAPEEEAVPSEGGMATPEQMDQLKELMSKIEDKYRQMNAEAFAGGNQVESQKKDLVLDVFKMLKELGVDLTDPASVKEFLDQMQETNPDLYDLFVSSFEGLIGQENGASVIPAGAEEAITGAPAQEQPGTGMPAMPGATEGPSNPGLSGMLPQEGAMPQQSGGMLGKFQNLAK